MKKLKGLILGMFIALGFGSVFALNYIWTSFFKVGIPITLPATQFVSGGVVSGNYVSGGTLLMQIGESGGIYTYVPLLDANGNTFITGGSLTGYLTGTNWSNTGDNIYNNNSGNVGIGTDTPGAYKLSVLGDTSFIGDMNISGDIYLETSTQIAPISVTFATGSDLSLYGGYSSTNVGGNLYLYGGGSQGQGGNVYLAGGGSLGVGGTTYIDGGNGMGGGGNILIGSVRGNIGIGTIPGTYKLNVLGNTMLNGSLYVSGYVTSDINFNTGDKTISVESSASSGYNLTIGAGGGGSSEGGDLILKGGSASGLGGNVVINGGDAGGKDGDVILANSTTNPGYVIIGSGAIGNYKLNVVGSGNFNSLCLSGDCITTRPTPSGSSSSLWNTGTSDSINYMSGNVGIGTTGPTVELEVIGTGKFDGLCLSGNCITERPTASGTTFTGTDNYFVQATPTGLKQSIYYTTGTDSIKFSNSGSMAAGNYMSLFGGQGNTMGSSSSYATIVGGNANVIGNFATHASIVGGRQNAIGNFSTFSSILGGWTNKILTFASYSSIIGGYNNTIKDTATYNILLGGYSNSIEANTDYGAVLGGHSNKIYADYSSILGGFSNQVSAGATYSIAIGKNTTVAFQDSFAFNNTGNFATTKSGTFNVNTYGGAYIYGGLQIGGSSTLSQIKLLSGALLASPGTGAIEYDGSKLYMTMGADVRQEFNTVSFAQLFSDFNGTPYVVTVATAGTFYGLTGYQAGISGGYLSYSTGDGTVTILTGGDGYYSVNTNLSFGGTSNATIHCGIGTGASNILPQIEFERKLGTAGDVGSASSAGIIFARIGEVYQMFCTADGNGNLINVSHIGMTFNKIGR